MRLGHPRLTLVLVLLGALTLPSCAPAAPAGQGGSAGPVPGRPGTSSTPSGAPAASGVPTASARPAGTTPPVPATPSPPTATRQAAARLQAVLDGFRAQESSPGLSATILFPDGTSWTGVSGMAEIVARRPVTPETAFPIASISKTFLAALVLELSGEGAFELDEPAALLLPDLELDPAITVRMLLDHTSGLRDFFEHRLIDRALQDEPSVWWSPTRALGYMEAPYFPPGTGSHYSNTNYLLLGMLAERATGRKLADQLRDRFLDPLALGSAWYQDAERPRAPLAHGYRLTGLAPNLGRQDLDDGTGVAPFRSVVTAAGGAGGLAADSLDVARWARALYGGDAIDSRSLAIMLSGVDHVATYQPTVPYGLGVQAVIIDGHRTFGHSGRFLGFRAAMRWLPDESLAIAVLSNQSRSDLGPLTASLLRVVLPSLAPCCPAPR